MIRQIVFVFMLVVLAGCQRGTPLIDEPMDSRDISRVVLTYSEKMRFDHHLHLEDSVIFYEDKIGHIRLDYSSMDAIDLWEGRRLLVELVEGLLYRLNQDPAIQAKFDSNPITANDLEIYIRFISFYPRFIDLQKIGLISLCQGVSNYMAADTVECDGPCWHRRSEWYDQSKYFVEYQREGEQKYGSILETERRPSALFEEQYVPSNVIRR